MSILDFFSSASSAQSETTPSSDSDSDESIVEPGPSKKRCSGESQAKVEVRQYQKKWEEEFPWIEFNEFSQGAFCKECKKTWTFQRAELEEHVSPNHSKHGKMPQKR